MCHVKVNISNGTEQTLRMPIANPSSEGPRVMALLLFLGASGQTDRKFGAYISSK